MSGAGRRIDGYSSSDFCVACRGTSQKAPEHELLGGRQAGIQFRDEGSQTRAVGLPTGIRAYRKIRWREGEPGYEDFAVRNRKVKNSIAKSRKIVRPGSQGQRITLSAEITGIHELAGLALRWIQQRKNPAVAGAFDFWLARLAGWN